MDGTLATSQDSIHVMEEITEDGSGVDGTGVESLGFGSVMTETLATSQDFYHDTLDFGGNGSIGGKGVDGNDGSKHTGDTDLFEEDKEEEEEEEEEQKELPLEVLLPGMTFASKADADKYLKEFFNKNYHPFVKVRVIKTYHVNET